MMAQEMLRRALAAGMALTPLPAAAEEGKSVRFGLSYTADLVANLSGGRERRAAWLGRADATMEADGEAVGLSGATFFVDLLYTHGPDFSGRRVGDAQVVSNVQGDGAFRPLEAWVSYTVTDTLSAKAGLVDLNTVFDVQSVGGFFLNSSHGIGPDLAQSGRNGPSIFPVTSSAIVLSWDDEGWSARGGLFNAVSGNPERRDDVRVTLPGVDGSLLIAEIAFDLAPRAEIQFGGWVYTDAQPRLDDEERRAKGNKGGYAQIEGRLAGPEEGAGLDGWMRLGIADSRINRIARYAGGGLTYGDGRSRFGIAVAHARQSDRAHRLFQTEEGAQARAETSLEFGYALQLNDYLLVQPHAHYVINPGWRSDVPDALVGGVRIAASIGG